jgi:carboxyl-terminal processing protease
LKLTAAKFYRISGESTQHQGVTPDVTFPTLVDSNQIGESTLEDAMPWDMIKPAVYTPLDRISSRIDTLRQRHQQRAVNDPYFDYYSALKTRSEANSNKQYLSLNEATRRSEKHADDDWRLALENRLRVATDKPPASDLEELEALVEAESAPPSDATSPEDPAMADIEPSADRPAPAESSTIEVVENDALLQEAGNIVADLVQMHLSDIGANEIADGETTTLPSGIAATRGES